jgi:uncharacterized membrane protein
MQDKIKRYRFFLVFGLIITGGAFLRLYMLSSQILVGDEWHGVAAVINQSFWGVFTQFNPAQNSSPLLNIYRLFLYKYLWLSEFTLRLPSILAGLLSVIVFPLLVKQFFNKRVALIFAALLSISPFLIFYSRFSRCYSLVLFFCFCTLFLFYRGLLSGKHRHMAGFILTGVLAAYTHLLALIPIVVPLIVALSILIIQRFTNLSLVHLSINQSIKSLLTIISVLLLILFILYYPALLQIHHLPFTQGTLNLYSLFTAMQMLCGTVNLPLFISFCVLCLIGLFLLIKQRPLLSCLFLTVICAYLLVILVSRPAHIERPIVLLRYMIIFIPIALIMTALALDYLIVQIQNRQSRNRIFKTIPFLITIGYIITLYIAGPLPKIYAASNNFINHSAFQASYQPISWDKSDAHHSIPGFQVTKDQIPSFYHWLKLQTDIRTIIEYPMDICNNNNLLYYYQHFHHKRVMVGYNRDFKSTRYTFQKRINNRVFCVWNLNACLLRADPEKLNFHNMIDITNNPTLSDSQADIIILHKLINGPTYQDTYHNIELIPMYYSSIPDLVNQYKLSLGPPIYVDAQIVCFRIK